jgi:hypothetical protein
MWNSMAAIAGSAVNLFALLIAGVWLGLLGALSKPLSEVDKRTPPPAAQLPPAAISQLQPPSSVLPVSAVQLVTEYKANELQADQNYKGRWLEVEGGVNDVSKATDGTPYIVLHGSAGSFSWTTVRCFISKKHAEWAPRIVRGQRIKVRGRCIGKPSDVHFQAVRMLQTA